MDFTATHALADIDMVTIHVWPENWGWGDATHDFEAAKAKALAYLAQHVASAKALGKPLLLEEFGLARDRQAAGADPLHVNRRNSFLAAMLAAADEHGVSGVLPWAWGGAGRPRTPGSYWRAGDDFIGDPPHEPQGWYSVFDTDTSTLALLAEGFAARGIPPITPAPPSPPAPPPLSPQPLPRAPPPACHSSKPDDVGFAICESWCADNSHCAYVPRTRTPPRPFRQRQQQ